MGLYRFRLVSVELLTSMISNPPVLSAVFLVLVEKRYGCRIWGGPPEKTGGGGGIVQPRPLSLYLHPGPGPQDPWLAPTVQRLNEHSF